jgi:hypothetical protein
MRLLIGILMMVAGTVANAVDLYSISAGGIDNPDIVWSRNIPVAGQEITISARVRGLGKHPVGVRFVLSCPEMETVTLEAAMEKAAGAGVAGYAAKWRPAEAGVYQLTVQVDPENRSGDSVAGNNSATVTLPVVWRELHIIPWGTESMRWLTGVALMPGEFAQGNAKWEYWRRRGVKALGMTHVLERQLMAVSEAKMIEDVMAAINDYARSGADGVMNDEAGSYATPDGLEFIRRCGVLYDKLHREHPQLPVYNFIAGPLQRGEIENGARNGQILMGECYDPMHARSGPTWRARLQYYTRVLGPNNIIALGTGRDVGRRFEPWIENSVRMIRELGPEMPGICYYCVAENERYEGGFNEFLDGLTFKYFIMPVLTLDSLRPLEDMEAPLQVPGGPVKPGDAVPLRARIRNIGGTPARNVGVRFYARAVESGKRTQIAESVVASIGNGTLDLVEEQAGAPVERLIDGVLHPMGRFGKTSRVVMEQAFVDATWTPQQEGRYRIEVEVQASDQYTILKGYDGRPIEVTSKPAAVPVARLAVTMDDIWLGKTFSPHVDEKIPLQVCIHNVGQADGENVAVTIHARRLDTNEATLLGEVIIKKIGTHVDVVQEEKIDSIESRVIDTVKHPTVREDKSTTIFYNRALLDVVWTPAQPGYWQIEVAIKASDRYGVADGMGTALRAVPVGKAAGSGAQPKP